jgi:hypothetical protein
LKCEGREFFLKESDLRLWRREIAGNYCVLEAGSRMRAVTERLVLRLAATAEADCRTPGKAECLARWVYDLEISFDANGSIGVDSNFCGWHESRS